MNESYIESLRLELFGELADLALVLFFVPDVDEVGLRLRGTVRIRVAQQFLDTGQDLFTSQSFHVGNYLGECETWAPIFIFVEDAQTDRP